MHIRMRTGVTDPGYNSLPIPTGRCWLFVGRRMLVAWR